MNTGSLTSSVFQQEKPNFSSSAVEPLRFENKKVRVPPHNSKWMMNLQDRFNELTALPLGWDGYVGKPVSFSCATFSANLIERLYSADIPTPQLVPGGDGSLQIEWHCNNYDIEIDVLAPYEITASRFNHSSGEDEELELQSDFTILAEWIQDLENNREQELRIA